MIVVVDYRAGNLTSVANALGHLGHAHRVTDSPADIAAADRIIFPGVGAAGDAMANLRELGLAAPIREAVTKGKPFLGICIGYQLLFESSAEGDTPCLGLLRGAVVRFPEGMRDELTGARLKVPEMGWNSVRFLRPHPVWRNVPEASEFYFVHSYYPVPEPDIAAGTTEYGVEFVSVVARDNLVAVQFHPEKSGRPGLKLLDDFCRWTP
ncbi:MAG: imidazole glycerol phosphate synthase subunit HisH [Kiritimatiellaeota bacterium]|nr:imidazole glycerol phosphate synthase subunit HisH [Kiritimatiellota bacterium]